MAKIPRTERKPREARFFLGWMHKAKESLALDREDFDFYLSAFLSAGRSVTFCLQNENKERYDAWFLAWRDALPETDRQLLGFMNGQRVAEVHKLGADVSPQVEMVPVPHAGTPALGYPAHYVVFGWTDEAPLATVGQRARYFELGETRQEAVANCVRYLEILKKLLQDFLQQFPDD